MNQESGFSQTTPVNILWDNILMIPIFGLIDSKRVQEIMESMLRKVIDTESKVIILDILGVSAIDSAVANQLIKITKATKLLGCHSIISGISPEVAQTLVQLGIELGEIITTATLKNALTTAFEILGLEVTKKK